jgi:hypothetical protein
MRKVKRKGSANILPSFTDQLSNMVEKLIENSSPE